MAHKREKNQMILLHLSFVLTSEYLPKGHVTTTNYYLLALGVSNHSES